MKRFTVVLILLISLTGFVFAAEWNFELKVHDGDRTIVRTLTLGTDTEGSEFYDYGFDIPTFAPPEGPYAYFPLDDPGAPYTTMLCTDIRNSLADEIIWEIIQAGDPSVNDRAISVDVADIPTSDIGVYYIGSAFPGFEVEAWTLLATIDSFFFAPGEYAAIKFLAADVTDDQAPRVIDYHPVGSGIMPNRNVEFIIYDDMTGVDETSLTVEVNGINVSADLELTAFTYGYYPAFEVVYDPPLDFDWSAEICVDIDARDLASPPYAMETFSYCFTILDDYDESPPYTENWDPFDGETYVPVIAPISVRVKDSGTGVNAASIGFNVNGESVTDEIEITEIGDPFSRNYIVSYTPTEPYPLYSWVTVWVSARDIIGNSMRDTIVFNTGFFPGFEWDAAITVWSGFGSDTTYRELYYGVGYCTDGYDACDAPIFCMPGTPCMFFLLDDPLHPDITKLQRDMRDGMSDSICWQIDVMNPGDNLGAFWEPDSMPYWNFAIGIGTEDTPPGEYDWLNMKVDSMLLFTEGDILWIRYSSDTLIGTSPFLSYTSPAGGDENVNPASPVIIEICDSDIGVDSLSIRVFLYDREITHELTWEAIEECAGYSLTYEHYDDLFDDSSYVCVRVSALDMDTPPNSLDTIFCFMVRPALTWSAYLIYHEFDGVDEELYGLVFGTDEDGTGFFDTEFDVQSYFAEDMFYAYFPIDDPIYPSITMLQTDIRDDDISSIMWEIHQEHADTLSDYWVTWDPEELLPEECDWHFNIAAIYPDEGMTTWVDMQLNDSLSVGIGQRVYIRKFWSFTPRTLCGVAALMGATDFTGIEISLISLEDDTLALQYTDSLGNFCFDDISASGTYNVCFHYEDYYDSCVPVEIVCDAILDEVELLLRCYTLSGYVDVPELEDDSGVQVTFTSPLLTDVSFTAEDGYYEFDCLYIGDYTVNLYLEDYPELNFGITITGDTTGVNWLLLPDCFLLDGTVTLDGTPASFIDVEIEGLGMYTTDETGYYFDTCVYAGTYIITVRQECYETVLEEIILTDSVTVDIDLPPVLIAIEGFISLIDEADFSDITVCIDGECVTTPSDGSYEFTGLECGADHVITASIDCYLTHAETVNVITDLELDFELSPIPNITGLWGTTDTLVRPLVEDSLCATLYWTEPTECCDSMHVMYILGDEYSDHIPDWEFGVTLPCGTILGDSGLVLCSLDPDIEFCFTLVTFCGGEFCPLVNEYVCLTVTTLPDPNQVLIYDFDNGATPIRGAGVEAAMAAVLDSLCVTYSVTPQDAALDLYTLTDYDAVFIALGVQDADDSRIPEPSLQLLIDYLEDRYSVYLEGPDFAAEYSTGSATENEFFSKFGITFEDDGIEESPDTFNVNTLRNQPLDWWSGRDLLIDYANGTIADRFVDEIGSDGATIILVDEEGKGYASTYTSGYQAIYSACYAGAMTIQAAERGRARLYDEYLRKFGVEIPCPGIVEKYIDKVPAKFNLVQNFPNPFNPVTNIEYSLPQNSAVDVSVYNIFGEKIVTLAEGDRAAGAYRITWNGSDENSALLPSGIYFCKLQAGGFRKTVKMMFMK
ncbi:T9SS type A sorting domain-containing protein [bacterium]|nr:T9SS type A sorting domain-containing protein [bacterium]